MTDHARLAREWLASLHVDAHYDCDDDDPWTEGTYTSLAALLARVERETVERCVKAIRATRLPPVAIHLIEDAGAQAAMAATKDACVISIRAMGREP